jgi:long-chain acyl-CoA synthetase
MAVPTLPRSRAPHRAWRILPRPLTRAAGELTPTLKVRRAAVVAQFHELVQEMYAA